MASRQCRRAPQRERFSKGVMSPYGRVPPTQRRRGRAGHPPTPAIQGSSRPDGRKVIVIDNGPAGAAGHGPDPTHSCPGGARPRRPVTS